MFICGYFSENQNVSSMRARTLFVFCFFSFSLLLSSSVKMPGPWQVLKKIRDSIKLGLPARSTCVKTLLIYSITKLPAWVCATSRALASESDSLLSWGEGQLLSHLSTSRHKALLSTIFSQGRPFLKSGFVLVF